MGRAASKWIDFFQRYQQRDLDCEIGQAEIPGFDDRAAVARRGADGGEPVLVIEMRA
jgi:hypothetical protein